jgi:hypothetical protein
MRCLALSSRRTIRSFGRFSRISSGGTRGISLGMSSGFCNAGHWLMGFGARVVDVVCNGCVDVLLHWSSRDGEDPSSCGWSSGVRCLLAARRSRAVSKAAFLVSGFREAPSLIRDSMEFNTKVSMSCELGIVRGSILVSLVYQEPKISCEALLLQVRIVRTLCEENAVFNVVQPTFRVVNEPGLA